MAELLSTLSINETFLRFIQPAIEHKKGESTSIRLPNLDMSRLYCKSRFVIRSSSSLTCPCNSLLALRSSSL